MLHISHMSWWVLFFELLFLRHELGYILGSWWEDCVLFFISRIASHQFISLRSRDSPVMSIHKQILRGIPSSESEVFCISLLQILLPVSVPCKFLRILETSVLLVSLALVLPGFRSLGVALDIEKRLGVFLTCTSFDQPGSPRVRGRSVIETLVRGFSNIS